VTSVRDDRYNAALIRELAGRLETSASITVGVYTVMGGIVGVGGGALIGLALQSAGVVALIGGVVGAVIGYFIGDARVVWLRLQAELALCQVAAEENSRAVRQATVRPGGLPAARPSKACPECAEEVPPAARVCRQCGHRFDPSTIPVAAPVAVTAERTESSAATLGGGPATFDRTVLSRPWRPIDPAAELPGSWTVITSSVHILSEGSRIVIRDERGAWGFYDASGPKRYLLIEGEFHAWSADDPGEVLIQDRGRKPMLLLKRHS
jgi:hypothetical protein